MVGASSSPKVIDNADTLLLNMLIWLAAPAACTP